MCDTLVIRGERTSWFAKNSDREPDEPQRVAYHPPVEEAAPGRVSCTYIDIPQVTRRHGVVISRPDWMWGAEMGVNDQGVAIGNEAVFSSRTRRFGQALLGMDLLRLGLERGGSAAEALGVIAHLLEAHGQGGPAGYRDKAFRYDNSFLIADPSEAFILETSGRDWVARRVAERTSISNAYSIRDDADLRSDGAPAAGFVGREFAPMRWLGRARDRQAATACASGTLEADRCSFLDLASVLRQHADGDGFEGGSNADVCMHAGGLLRPSHTTSSMIAKLEVGAPPRIAVTGTKTPCLSLFRPAGFEVGFSVMQPDVWEAGAALHDQAAADPGFRVRLKNKLAAAEAHLLPRIEAGDLVTAEALARAWDAYEFERA